MSDDTLEGLANVTSIATVRGVVGGGVGTIVSLATNHFVAGAGLLKGLLAHAMVGTGTALATGVLSFSGIVGGAAAGFAAAVALCCVPRPYLGRKDRNGIPSCASDTTAEQAPNAERIITVGTAIGAVLGGIIGLCYGAYGGFTAASDMVTRGIAPRAPITSAASPQRPISDFAARRTASPSV